MLGKIITVSSGIAAVLLLILLETTAPSSAGPVGILAVFFLLYIVLIGGVTYLLWGGSRLIGRLGRLLRFRRPPPVLGLQRSYYFASVLALGPVMLIAMNSVGQVSFYEIFLVLLFMVIGSLYITKRTA